VSSLLLSAATLFLLLPPSSCCSHSYKVNECMRQVYEPLLLEAQVDVVFNGHVHVSGVASSHNLHASCRYHSARLRV
jgi:hypothetical protein